MRSYLNLIELSSGRQLRLAELGFSAERPSFCENGIEFSRADGRKLCYSFKDGSISELSETRTAAETDGGREAESGADSGRVTEFDTDTKAEKRDYFLKFYSEPVGGIAYVGLTRRSDGAVIARFMGGEGSLGDSPVSPDGWKIVFFGYTNEREFSRWL